MLLDYLKKFLQKWLLNNLDLEWISYKINGRITGGYNISSSEYGGGIAVRNSGNLILESGMITKNQAIRGGGVEVATNSKFVMNGGLITNNKCIYNASELGGGIHVFQL